MEEIIELNQLEDSEVNKVRVANARTRPNSTGLYGGGALSADDVKKIFDKYPDLLRQKLAEVIDFANSLLKILGNGAEGATITGALNSLSERVGIDNIAEDSRFGSNTLASAILKLSEDLGAVETSPFSAKYDPENGILRFKTNGNIFASVDLPLESVFVGADYDDENGNLVLTLVNGSKVSIKNDALIAKIEEALFSEELPEAMYNSIVTEGGMKVTLSGGKLKFTGGGSGGGGGTTVTVDGQAVAEFDADAFFDEKFGDIDAALDRILEIQDHLIGNTYDTIIEEQQEILDLQNNLIGGGSE